MLEHPDGLDRRHKLQSMCRLPSSDEMDGQTQCPVTIPQCILNGGMSEISERAHARSLGRVRDHAAQEALDAS